MNLFRIIDEMRREVQAMPLNDRPYVLTVSFGKMVEAGVKLEKELSK